MTKTIRKKNNMNFYMNKNDILSVPDASVNLLDITTDKYYRTLTGGHSNFLNGINGIRCDEGKHDIHNNLGTIKMITKIPSDL